MESVLLILLIIVLVGAVGTALVVRATSRKQARLDAAVRPALGSPAQVWTARGERLLGELHTELAGSAFGWLSADAAEVVEELRTTATRVAELDQALVRVAAPEAEGRLRASRDGLLARMQAAVRGLEEAKAEVIALMIDTGVPSLQGDADERLAARVAGLRSGMAEVHRLASGQGLT